MINLEIILDLILSIVLFLLEILSLFIVYPRPRLKSIKLYFANFGGSTKFAEKIGEWIKIIIIHFLI